MIRVVDGINAFFDHLAAVDVVPLLFAVLAQLVKLGCTGMAWRGVLAAAYPEERVRRLPIIGAYLAGVGVNAVIPARAGDAVRIVLAHRSIPRSTYTTVVSSTLVLTIFDLTMATTLLVFAIATESALPRIGDLPRLPSFDFAWFLEHPLPAELLLALILIALAIVGVWVGGHVANFWARVRQAFAVLRSPARYFRTVAIWQAGDWTLRFVTIWFMLDAFGIPQSFRNVLLVQVSASVATVLPLTPAGIGTEQAFLLYVLNGTVASSELLAFSVGMRITLIATNVVAGFTAIALTLRTFRYKSALGRAGDVSGHGGE